MKPKLIPHDVVTRWNSTYDMLCCALAYRQPIEVITADKALKLRRFELDDEDWDIIGDLVAVLEVRASASCLPRSQTYSSSSNTKKLLYSSLEMLLASQLSFPLWTRLRIS